MCCVINNEIICIEFSGFIFLCRIGVEGCRSVSLLTEATNLDIQQHLYKKIENGEYKIGQLIVLQEFIKLTTKNDKVLTEQVVITGRKIPLPTIRYHLFKKHEKSMRLSKDLEFENMSRHELTKRLRKINGHSDANKLTELNVLINKLKTYEITRHVMCGMMAHL